MEKIQNLSWHVEIEVNRLPGRPTPPKEVHVDPRSQQIEEAIREVLKNRSAWKEKTDGH